ncbi:MAG: hypothetical protein ACJ72H_29345 [Candidatus Sulfotelmatobacter sp.]|jgi:hypothetical protein
MPSGKLALIVLAACWPMYAQNAIQPIERYNNAQSNLMIVGGRLISARIAIRDWQIHGQQKVERFPETGTLIVQLQSGRITTTIGGSTTERQPGEHWTVSAGTPMSVQVTTESAVLHVVSITR